MKNPKNFLSKFFLGLAGFSAALFFVMPSLTYAAVMRTDNIEQNEVIPQDLYVTGGNPVVAGTVQGDLVASGGNIYVTGNILHEAMIAGGTINISGHVGGDVRVLCGNLTIDGPIDGELLALCGTVFIGPHAVIRGDVNIRGGQVQVDPQAKFLSSTVNIISGRQDQQTAPRPYFDTNKFLTLAFWIGEILIMIGLLVSVAILYLIFPNFTKRFLQKTSIQNHMFWKDFLVGLLLLIVMPVVAIMCFVTGIGAILGALILIAYAAFILASVLFGGVVFGGLMFELLRKNKKSSFGWWWLIAGIIVLHLLTLIPFIGWIIGFIFFLVAWGALAKVRFFELKAVK